MRSKNKSQSLPNLKKHKNKIPSSINVNTQIEDDTSIAESEDTSLGSMVDWDLTTEEIQPRTSGGGEEESRYSKEEEEPKMTAAQKRKLNAQKAEQEFFARTGYDYSPYPVWGEIEWNTPIELQRIPSLNIFLPEAPSKKHAKPKDEHKKPPLQQTHKKPSFVEFVSDRLANLKLSESQKLNVRNSDENVGWMQKVLSGASVGSASVNIGLDIDSSFHHSDSSEKTLKSGHIKPKAEITTHAKRFLANASAASSLSKGS